jgi:hypothetical protein
MSVDLQALLEDRLPELGPGTPNEARRRDLAALTPESLFLGQPLADRGMAQGCLAGLWLWHNFLDESHAISQELHTPNGSFWHAIMHRREPDAWNSKYWWQRVGPHPVVQGLIEQAPSLGYAYVNPQEFVDHCERVRGTNTPEEDLARRVQSLEWNLLFENCRRRAVGG